MSPASWSKGPAEVENEVRFIRKLHRGSFLILEGDTDVRFWEPRIAPNLCELVQADGKPNVVGAVERLDAGQFTGALGLVDDDFDRLLGRSHRSRNIIATPDHDLECKGSADIAALLRQAHDEGELHAGHLGRSIRAWESRNPPYRVLPTDVVP